MARRHRVVIHTHAGREGPVFTTVLTQDAFTICEACRPAALLAMLIRVGFSANRNGKLQIPAAKLAREGPRTKTPRGRNRGSEFRLQVAMAHRYQTAFTRNSKHRTLRPV